MRMLRQLGLVVVLGGIVWGVLAVGRSPNRTDLSTYWALVAGVVAAMAAVIAVIPIVKKTRARDNGGQGDERPLEDLADRLARAVKKQWTDAAMDRRLVQSEAIQVRWELSSRGLVGPVSAGAGSRRFPPVRGLAAVREEQLRRGGLRDLHAVYGGLRSGRLVIVGCPGAGKTGASVLLVLQALEHREHLGEADRAGAPVPVMFTVHGWDPNTQRVQDWLVSRLQQTYPLFAGKGGAARAADLLQAGKIAVILDGLDEIAEDLQPVALQALSDQAVFRLVILSRSAEMTTAAKQALLEGAVAIELQDVVPSAAADYLTRVQLDPPPAGWRELTDRLRTQPDSPIAKALSNPLTLTLVRDTYRGGDNVRELLEFSGDAEHPVSREDIENHLIDRVLPAAYTPRPGQTPPRYDLQTAQRALSSIAAQMNQDGTRDLAWWRISAWVRPIPRIISSVIVGCLGLVGGLVLVGVLVAGIYLVGADRLVAGLVIGLMFGLGLGLGLGLIGGRLVGFALARRFPGSSPHRIAPTPWRSMVSRSSLKFGLTFGLRLGLTALAWVFFRAVLSGGEFKLGLGVALMVGLVVGLVGVLLGLVSGLFRPGTDDASPLSPLASWSRNRSVGLVVGLVVGLGLVVGIGLAVVLGPAGGTEGLGLGSSLALLAGCITGALTGAITGAIMSSAIWAASLAFAQLASRLHTPVRLMRFLEDARERNVLRTAGPVYQFRHARLQDRLAAQVKRTTNTDTVDSPGPSAKL